MTIETPRLLLRPVTAADAPDLHALDNDPEVTRHINGGTPVARDTFEAQLLPTFLERDPRHPARGFHAVTARAETATDAAASRLGGDFLGWVSLRATRDDPHALELGYRFTRAAWGHGYATEAARALVAAGFADPEVTQIFATTYEDNAASRRVMEKLGMTLRRRFRPTEAQIAGGTAHPDQIELWPGDDVEYALDR